MSDKNSYLVFSGTNSRYLAEKICASLGCPLGNLVVTKFSDGEFGVSFEESIRGRDVFLVQSTFPNSDNLMELLLMIDAAKRASARHIIAVVPSVGLVRTVRTSHVSASVPNWLPTCLALPELTASSPWTSMQTRFRASSMFQ